MAAPQKEAQVSLTYAIPHKSVNILAGTIGNKPTVTSKLSPTPTTKDADLNANAVIGQYSVIVTWPEGKPKPLVIIKP